MRPQLNVLSSDLIQQILAEAKRILGELGIEVRGKALRQRLLDHGIKTDASGERLLFSPDLVDWAVAQCPSSFTLYGRDGEAHAKIGGDIVNFVAGSSGLKFQHHYTGQIKEPTTPDFVSYVRLGDGLEHIPYLATVVSTVDVEVEISDAWRLYLCLANSKKPVVSGAFTEHGTPRMAELMVLFRQDKADLIARPMSIFTITATGNFRYGEDSCQNLLDCVEWGIPVEIVPVTLMGLIAPVTLVGSLVFHCVDTLAGIVMAQIVKPGAPVLYGGAPAEFHMKEATSPVAGIKAFQLDIAYVEIAKYLGLPAQSYMALSDSKFIDAQAGAETFGSALLAALAGVNSVSGPGMLDYLMVFNLAKLVFDNEVCGQALELVKEIEVVEDLPAIDLARQLLNEQHLVTAEHTKRHWENHLYLPSEIYDRANRENWSKRGSARLAQRCATEVDRRLAAYVPQEIEPTQDQEMRRIIKSGLKGQESLPKMPAFAPQKNRTPNRKKRQRKWQRN